MNLDEFQERVEYEIAANQRALDLAESLERLEQNKDFQKLILDGYFVNEAVENVAALSAPAVDTAASQAKIFEQLRAVSQLQQYFIKVRAFGSFAASALAEYEAEE